jgi:hypothetical protein
MFIIRRDHREVGRDKNKVEAEERHCSLSPSNGRNKANTGNYRPRAYSIIIKPMQALKEFMYKFEIIYKYKNFSKIKKIQTRLILP